MTTNYLTITGLLLLMISACTPPPRYVPAPSEVGITARGSYIVLSHVTPGVKQIKGELIAVEDNEIYVLTGESVEKELKSISANYVRSYRIKYAYTNRFNWSPPVYGLISIFHGWWLVFTLPINLITTSVISNGGSFRYTEKSMPAYLLNRYARFPQGLPDGFDLKYLE